MPHILSNDIVMSLINKGAPTVYIGIVLIVAFIAVVPLVVRTTRPWTGRTTEETIAMPITWCSASRRSSCLLPVSSITWTEQRLTGQ